jgi:hypothetical protein
LSGIPLELRQLFDELVQQPLLSSVVLHDQVEEHLAAIEQEHGVNEFVDLAGAQVLAHQCRLLLDRWGSFPFAERQLAHAAIRYFVSWDDLEPDLDVGGLDDDKQIMHAVLSYLGIQETHDGLGKN